MNENESMEPQEAQVPAKRPGEWYAISTYAGQGTKAARNLTARAATLGVEDDILEVVTPEETITEVRNGSRHRVTRNLFPGYLLVRMRDSAEALGAVTAAPGVVGFAGGARNPAPLSRREVEKFLGIRKEEKQSKPKSSWKPGDQVKVVARAFADYDAVVDEVRDDQRRIVGPRHLRKRNPRRTLPRRHHPRLTFR